MPTATTDVKARPVTRVVVYRREPPDPWERAIALFLLYVAAGATYLFQLL